MGRCYVGLRKNLEAERALETAVEIDPNRADAQLYLGGCYLQDAASQLSAGRRTDSFSCERKAREHLQRAVELDPNGQTGKQAQNALAAIGR
jgi:tetratricopeptide (TPR) repeat protein